MSHWPITPSRSTPEATLIDASLENSPLSQRRVQWTISVFALIAISGMLVAGIISQPQHNAAENLREATLLRIDLNTAESRELALLPGVGPVLAQRIVENRDRLGPFRSVDDLARVHGIGAKTIDRLGDVCEVKLDGSMPGEPIEP